MPKVVKRESPGRPRVSGRGRHEEGVQLSVRFSRREHAHMAHAANRSGVSINQLLRDGAALYIEAFERKGRPRAEAKAIPSIANPSDLKVSDAPAEKAADPWIVED